MIIQNDFPLTREDAHMAKTERCKQLITNIRDDGFLRCACGKNCRLCVTITQHAFGVASLTSTALPAQLRK